MPDVRNDALTAVMAILEDKRPSHLVISDYLAGAGTLSPEDKSFFKKLVQGTVERVITLDYVINRVSSTKTAKMKPAIRDIVRMGTYQLLYMKVPDPAACNESVKLAKKRRFDSLGGFVNGVLRNIARRKDELTDFGAVADSVERLGTIYSMPEWIVRYFTDAYGIDAAVTAFEYFLTDNKTSIRCNISRIDPGELKERLEERGIDVETVPGPDKCFKISGYSSLEAIPEFKEGLFAVQDLSSVMAGEAAEVHPGDRILDLCAAPGGKSLNLADRLAYCERGDGCRTHSYVLACDLTERKVAMIVDNARRCGFDDIRTRVGDATVFCDEFLNAFDTVICDVPCSGLGIIGKKPDIKYNMTPVKQHELVGLQRSILDNAVRYVKPGGQLIFSTCTVNRAENEENVDYLISKGFNCTAAKQLLPGQEGTDGFFYARLVKSAE